MGFFDLGLGDVVDFVGQERANKANAKQAAKNRQFQERMSSTAHQREVADLRAAGLNPILSATGGSGASTPGGGQATMLNSARGLGDRQRAATIAKEQIKNLTADTALKMTSSELGKSQIQKTHQEALNLIQGFDLLSAQTMAAQATAKGVDLDNQLKQLDIEMYEKTPGGKLMKAFGPLMGGAIEFLNRFKDSGPLIRYEK